MAAGKNVPINDSSGKSSNFSDVNLMVENSLIQAKKYLIPFALVLAILFVVTIIVAFFINNKRDNVANAYAALHKALSQEQDDQEGEEKKVLDEKRLALLSVIESYPDTPAAIDAKFQMAKIEYDKGNFRDAAKKFAEFHQEFPDQRTLSQLALMSEATCYLSLKKFEKAKEKYQAILNGDKNQDGNPFNAQAHYQIALCDLLLGNYEQAKSSLNSLLTSTEDENSKEKAQSLLAKVDILLPENLRNAILAEEEGRDQPIEPGKLELDAENSEIQPISLQATPSSQTQESSTDTPPPTTILEDPESTNPTDENDDEN